MGKLHDQYEHVFIRKYKCFKRFLKKFLMILRNLNNRNITTEMDFFSHSATQTGRRYKLKISNER